MQHFGIKEKQGVIVTDIVPDSPSDAAGLDKGDIILEINKRPINNIVDYQDAIKGIKDDCLIKTQRGYYLLKKE